MHDGNESHFHTHADGTVHSHEQDEPHAHGHVHANTKVVKNRLARVIGHLHAVERMLDDERDCAEVLIQLAAVKSAVNNTGKLILKDHIEHCLVDAIESGDTAAIEELKKAIDQFMK